MITGKQKEALSGAVNDWFKIMNSQEARIKELEEAIDLKDIGIREQKVIISSLENKIKQLQETIKTANRIINSI